jgi:hypothetical protein
MYFFMVVTKDEMSKFPDVFNHTYVIPQIPSDRYQIYIYVQHHTIQESYLLCVPDSWLTLDIAAVVRTWPLPGSPRNDQSTLHSFQKRLLCCISTASVMSNVFETDRKRLLVHAQRFPSYQTACSPPRQQQVTWSLTVVA